jgi:hypothetical protein
MMVDSEVEARARRSGDISRDATLQMVCRALGRRKLSGERMIDVGFGEGNLYHHVRSRFDNYIGVDAARYDQFPPQAEFCRFDLDSPLPDSSADVVTAREFARIYAKAKVARKAGWLSDCHHA